MKKTLTGLLAICIAASMCMSVSAFELAVPEEPSAQEQSEMVAEGESPEGESAEGESAEGESEGGSGGAEYDMGSGRPDTSMGGNATSAPPDNSTKAMDILGTRAAIYIEYTEDGYTVTNNITDVYTIENGEIAVPVFGANNQISGLYISCETIDWDEENAVGNSALVINDLTDEETTFSLGGEEDLYEAPNGEKYNSVILMKMDENEEYDTDATETAPGVGIGFNGKAIALNNVYVESNGVGRPSIHIPSSSRDKNVKQYSDLIISDSYVINHDTRALLLMGGDVWFLNSKAITDSWGALSYDNTSTTMYVVNSLSEQTGSGYSVYDAAGCTTYIYGSRVISGGTGITVARDAVLYVAPLEDADEAAIAPYEGTADLLTPSITADGRSIVVGYDYPIKIHADMAGPDTHAVAIIKDAYLSTDAADVQLSNGKEFTPSDSSTGSIGSDAMNALVDDYQTGEIIEIACHSGKVVLDNCELNTRDGMIVHSFFTYDSMASGIYPVDGAEYIGDDVTITNMDAVGDILHDDYMRKMVVKIENASLTGSVYGTTLAGWNNYWNAQIEAIGGDEEDATLVIHDETYESLWGVRMSLDAASTWNVAGTSQLYSFTMEEGATVQPVEGKTMTIYVDCTMDNALESYDIEAGTTIDAFEADVEYTGVVIVVE